MVDISALLPKNIKVVVSHAEDGTPQYLELRPLNFEEIVQVILKHKDLLVKLYGEFKGATSQEAALSALLLHSPDFVADIIAMGADAVGQEEAIKRLPTATQLVALYELWQASVPDPTKAKQMMEMVNKSLSEQAANNPSLSQIASKPVKH